MNNLLGVILGITDDNNSEWKYINRKGHVITCTKAQFRSYFKKRRTAHEQIMKEAISALFTPNPWYRSLKSKEKGVMKCDSTKNIIRRTTEI